MTGDGTYGAAYKVARSLVGYKPPGPDTDDNKISRWYGVTTAWCAETMSYVLATARVPMAFRSTRVTLFARHYASIGRAGRTPRVGALACFDWEQDGLYDHIGLVVGVDATGRHLATIEGNTTPGGPIGVYLMPRSVSLVRLFCYPGYAAVHDGDHGVGFRPHTGDFALLDWRVPASAWQRLHPGQTWLSDDGRDLLRQPAETWPKIARRDGAHNERGQYVLLLSDLARAVENLHHLPVSIPRSDEMTDVHWNFWMTYKRTHNVTPWNSLDHSDVIGPSTVAVLTNQHPA
jgi:hypothetical protein